MTNNVWPLLIRVLILILEGLEAREAAERVASSSSLSAEKILSLLPDRYL